jgi:hypothetical protein
MHRSFSGVPAALMLMLPSGFLVASGSANAALRRPVPSEISAKNLLFRHDLLGYRSGREEGTA